MKFGQNLPGAVDIELGKVGVVTGQGLDGAKGGLELGGQGLQNRLRGGSVVRLLSGLGLWLSRRRLNDWCWRVGQMKAFVVAEEGRLRRARPPSSACLGMVTVRV